MDAQLLPLAILMSLIFENKDADLTETAHEYISKRAVSLNPNHYSGSIQLKEPFPVPTLKDGKVEGKDLLVRLKLDDCRIIDVGEFTVRKDRECCLNINFEYVKLAGEYFINGTVHEEDFNGRGSAQITLRDVSSETRVDRVVLHEDIVNGRINQLKFDFDFKRVEFEPDGLNIRNIPKSEVRRMLNSVGKVYLKQNKKTLSEKLSTTIRDRLNHTLKDKNKDEIITLLKQGGFTKTSRDIANYDSYFLMKISLAVIIGPCLFD